MTPTYLNFSSPSTFSAADDLHHPILFAPNNYLPASSSSSLSTHIFFGSSRTQDQSGFYHTKLQHSQIQQDQVKNFASRGGIYDMENEGSRHNGLKFSIWKKDDKYQNHHDQSHDPTYQVKWMSSKMRLMHKMKNVDRMAVNSPPNSTTTSTTLIKLEDQKQQASSPVETDTSSNSNNPIRVCSDCNTTKTPLWRSGPQGPKSLCNACGIRQRKARRAMAAAAAAAENGTAPELTETTPAPKTKTTEQNDKRTISSTTGHVAKFKKRSKLTGSSCRKKLCLEELLRSLSKSLDFHQVFPQDEKDAAILLMALSCDHAHV